MGKAKRRKTRGYCGCDCCDPTTRVRKCEEDLDRLALEEADQYDEILGMWRNW